MKKILTILMLSLSFTVFAQSLTLEPSSIVSDSVSEAQKKSPFLLTAGAGLYSRFFWRGVKFGTGVSIQGYADLSIANKKKTNAFGVGAFTTVNFVGSIYDYGNTTNLYVYYTQNIGDKSNFTLYIDDYYFYTEDNLTNAFDYDEKTTPHYIETRAEIEVGRVDGIFGYSIYQGANQETAPYIELGFGVNDNTRIFAGGVTGASALNFQTKAGITNIGVTQNRDIKKIPFEFTFACNPFYQNIMSDGSGTSPYRNATASAFSFVIAIAFE